MMLTVACTWEEELDGRVWLRESLGRLLGGGDIYSQEGIWWGRISGGEKSTHKGLWIDRA